MHPVYATRLSVYSHEDAPAPLGTARVAEVVHHWVAELAREHECVIHEVDPRSTPGAWLEGDAEWQILDARQRPAGQIHRWALDSSSDRDGDPAWAWQWIVEHPLNAIAVAGAAPLLLRTEVQARDVPESGDGPEGRATVVIIRQFTTFHGHPAPHHDLVLPPPSLVRRLVEGFSVRRGDIRQTLGYWPVDHRKVDMLVRAIENPAREIPIVVISRDRMGSLLIDYRYIGEQLLGIAKVAILGTGRAADELDRHFRGAFPLFNGAARVFEVEFTRADTRNRHHVWVPRYFAGREEQLAPSLCQEVTGGAARWIVPDQVIADLPRQRLQRGIAASLAREIEKEGLASEFLQLSQSYEQDIAQARADLAAKDDELREKSEEIYKLRARVADLDHALNGNDLHLEAPTDTVPVALAATSLLDAVRIAQDEADWAAIEFLPAALESAKRVQVDDPNDALTKLRALIDVAQDFHDSPGDGTWIKKAFEQRGIRYSPKVGPSTKGQHADDYTCLWDNNGEPRKISFDSHIRLSQRHRVYWYEAKQERKFVVGHVGDHLPN